MSSRVVSVQPYFTDDEPTSVGARVETPGRQTWTRGSDGTWRGTRLGFVSDTASWGDLVLNGPVLVVSEGNAS